jgi:hypothetical protein
LAEILTWADNPTRAAFFRRAFDDRFATGRTTLARNPTYDCRGFFAKAENFASEDMARWRLAAGKQVQPTPERAGAQRSKMPNR